MIFENHRVKTVYLREKPKDTIESGMGAVALDLINHLKNGNNLAVSENYKMKDIYMAVNHILDIMEEWMVIHVDDLENEEARLEIDRMIKELPKEILDLYHSGGLEPAVEFYKSLGYKDNQIIEFFSEESDDDNVFFDRKRIEDILRTVAPEKYTRH